MSLRSAIRSLAVAFSPIAAFNALFPKDRARAVRDIAYGPLARHKLDVYTPHEGRGPWPVVVFFYGGGWSSGRRQDYGWAARAIASRGFVVATPDYRLFPDVRYPAFLKDGAMAASWALEHAREYGGEARGLFLAGHSAGAYNAVQLALEPSHLRQEGVEPRLISGVVALAGPYDFLPLDVKATIDAFGEWHDLPATQPINHVRRDAPPMLLIHGTRDTVVGPYHTERLARALRRAGARVEEKIYEGADHSGVVLALSRAFRGKASVLDDMVRFLTDLA